ncbi:MAG: site-specific DNA-methyltransferase [Candidatus Marinimicrobia bacterium]|nr:site-specific DNA-methyltransferase [Candidatus Neomarinimicrobiota bacterium]
MKKEEIRSSSSKRKRRTELVYTGKSTALELLSEPSFTNLHITKEFGLNERWYNRIIFGENFGVLKYFLQQGNKKILANSDGSVGVRLIYIDPPFGTGDIYSRNHVNAYSARRTGVKYIDWLRKRIILLRELLTEDGSFYMRIDYHFGHYMRVILDEVFGAENFHNEIIINRTKKIFDGISKFNIATDTLFFYTKTNNYIFHGVKKPRSHQKWIPMHSPGIRWTKVEEDYLSFYSDKQLEIRRGRPCSRGRVFDGKVHIPPAGRHWTFTQKRLEKYLKEGRIRKNTDSGMLEYFTSPEEIVDSNWTDIPGYTFKWGYPTENSEQLLERIISASSNEGDIVLDIFAGSGTTGAVAEKMGRRWIMVDSSKTSIYTIQRRMLSLNERIGNKGNKLQPTPYAVYEAYPMLESVSISTSFETYKKNVLAIFKCEASQITIGSQKVDGKLNRNPVIVFNWEDSTDRMVYEGYLRMIHRAISGNGENLVYIIAPVFMVAMFSDSVILDKIEYQILKIPVSIMDLLLEEISALKWREEDINKIVKSIAFDFIQPPTVSSQYLIHNFKDVTECSIKILDFQTNAMLKKPLPDKEKGIKSLRMISIDTRFDGKTFRPQFTFFEKDLAANEYTCHFPISDIDNQLLICYSDMFGNEKRELRRSKYFRSEP